MTFEQIMNFVTHKQSYSPDALINLKEVLKDSAEPNLRDVDRTLRGIYIVPSANSSGIADHSISIFARKIGLHIDGEVDPIFDGTTDRSSLNQIDQLCAYRDNNHYVRIMVRDIVNTKYDDSWCSFLASLLADGINNEVLALHGLRQDSGIDEAYFYSVIDDKNNWFKEPVVLIIANMLQSIAMCLKEVRLEQP